MHNLTQTTEYRSMVAPVFPTTPYLGDPDCGDTFVQQVYAWTLRQHRRRGEEHMELSWAVGLWRSRPMCLHHTWLSTHNTVIRINSSQYYSFPVPQNR